MSSILTDLDVSYTLEDANDLYMLFNMKQDKAFSQIILKHESIIRSIIYIWTQRQKQRHTKTHRHIAWVASQEALVFVRVTSLTLPLFSGDKGGSPYT